MVDAVESNRAMWTKLRDETKTRRLSSTNSLDFFHIQFKSELNGSNVQEGIDEGDEEQQTANNNTKDHNDNQKWPRENRGLVR